MLRGAALLHPCAGVGKGLRAGADEYERMHIVLAANGAGRLVTLALEGLFGGVWLRAVGGPQGGGANVH